MLKNKDHAAAGPCKDHVLLPTTKTIVQGLFPAKKLEDESIWAKS